MNRKQQFIEATTSSVLLAAFSELLPPQINPQERQMCLLPKWRLRSLQLTHAVWMKTGTNNTQARVSQSNIYVCVCMSLFYLEGVYNVNWFPSVQLDPQATTSTFLFNDGFFLLVLDIYDLYDISKGTALMYTSEVFVLYLSILCHLILEIWHREFVKYDPLILIKLFIRIVK